MTDALQHVHQFFGCNQTVAAAVVDLKSFHQCAYSIFVLRHFLDNEVVEGLVLDEALFVVVFPGKLMLYIFNFFFGLYNSQLFERGTKLLVGNAAIPVVVEQVKGFLNQEFLFCYDLGVH